MTDPIGFSTRAIHEGYNPLDEQGALAPPVYMTSTFVAETSEELGARFAGEAPGHFYSRISNPTVDLLERRVASLEGAESSLGTASGMGAIAAAIWTLIKPGDEILVDKTLYGCTFAFMKHGLTRFGVTINHVDMTRPENLAAIIGQRTRIVYFETPANPNMRLVDIEAISEIAHAHEATVIVDNTYASPYLTRPVEHGADLVVHSATKYLGGHGDLVAGIVAGTAEIIKEIRLSGLKDMTGAVMSPFTAMLVLRGLKTLSLRMERHCFNAQRVADYLQGHPALSAIHYPGLLDFKQHDLAKRQMRDFGGMIAFELHGGIAAGKSLIDNLKLIHCAVSLGDADTLVQHPATMTHSTYTEDERAEFGISEGLVRLSVGLEDVEDIIADLDASLPTVGSAASPA
ncbi:MAG: methionine gamma-lyase [Sphingopyxis sp.]|nr:MAG: methionine gamma-lyase [Sphingopyxis sp.]